MRRRGLFVALACAVVAVVTGVVVADKPADAGERNTAAFRGLGAWIDVFDYVPAFITRTGPPAVTIDTVDDLASLGADTIYLQAAIDDPRAKGLVVDRGLVGALLRRAHENDVRVVAWYYPQLVEPARDRHRLEALLDFRAHGDRFDAVALDIESRQVVDVVERNRRVVALTRQIRKVAGDRAVGAIVYPAVQLEVVNPALWPDFPYRKLARHVDVWLPMAYWTYREDPYRDAARYTQESVRRLRNNLDDPEAAVHPVGGLGALSTPEDYAGLVRAARRMHALGWSVYDADTTATTAWVVLRGH
ncbi:MAG: hypothetical protein EXQ79_09290 [Acidimicrobiia bacterium]|nr:hypothetical protein [Acidimicrobiia bacterium]